MQGQQRKNRIETLWCERQRLFRTNHGKAGLTGGPGTNQPRPRMLRLPAFSEHRVRRAEIEDMGEWPGHRAEAFQRILRHAGKDEGLEAPGMGALEPRPHEACIENLRNAGWLHDALMASGRRPV